MKIFLRTQLHSNNALCHNKLMHKRKSNNNKMRGSNLLIMTKNRVTIRERDSVLISIKGNMRISKNNLTNNRVVLMMRRMNGPRVLLYSVIL